MDGIWEVVFFDFSSDSLTVECAFQNTLWETTTGSRNGLFWPLSIKGYLLSKLFCYLLPFFRSKCKKITTLLVTVWFVKGGYFWLVLIVSVIVYMLFMKRFAVFPELDTYITLTRRSNVYCYYSNRKGEGFIDV